MPRDLDLGSEEFFFEGYILGSWKDIYLEGYILGYFALEEFLTFNSTLDRAIWHTVVHHSSTPLKGVIE